MDLQEDQSTWSLATPFLSYYSLIKVFRDSTITSFGISSEVLHAREVSLIASSSFFYFYKAFSILSFFLAFVRKFCFALVVIVGSALLGGGEAGLEVS